MQPNLTLANIARNPSESVRPDLWPAHAWVPALGIQGSTLLDVAGRANGQVSGATWRPDSLNFTRNDYVEVPRYESLEPAALTVIVRIKFNAFPIRWSGIIAKDYTSFEEPYYSYHIRGDANYGRICATLVPSEYEGHIGLQTPSVITSGVWYTVALIYDVNRTPKAELILNGSSVATSNSAITIAYYDTPLRIGKSCVVGNSPGNDKSIANVGLYHRGLNASAIRDLSADPLLPFRRRAIQPYWVLSGVPTGVFNPFEGSVFTSMRFRSSSIG